MLKIRNRTITILLFALCLMICSNISQFYLGNYNDNSNRNQITDPISDIDVINHLKTAANEPNGNPLLIYQHSTISNSFFPPTLPTNVSFTLLEGWTSKNVTINYEGVSHKKDWVINGSFDTGESPWEYKSSIPAIIIHQSWASGDVTIDVDKSQAITKGDYGYFEENFTIAEIPTTNPIATLSMNYKYAVASPASPSTEINAYISIIIGGIEKNVSISFPNLVEGSTSWTPMSVTYDMSEAGQELPGNVTLRAGIIVNESTSTPNRNQFLDLDDIQFTVWTEPNEPNLIIAEDLEFSSEYSFQNITNGRGKTFIDVERSKTELGDLTFTISKNDTFTEELKVYNITITSEAVKIFNSTIDLQDGSLYTLSTNIEWQIECLFDFLPFTYTNNWVEIKKPSDWNITSVLDGYTVEKGASCTGKQLGSENLQIPKGVFTPGLWKIKAVSQNYLSKGSLIIWNGTTYNEESRVTWGDTFQINVTLNNTVTYANTNVSCTIEYPNGTLYWQGSKELSSYNLKFGNFSVGSNMPVGDYQVIVEWTNNNTYLSRDQAGFAEFGFKLWHNTSLTAVDSDFERISGGPLLIKVRFFDIDINEPVHFASIKYNSTFGASGVMIYLGSGVYFIDIDTSSLGLGDYYFSFNSTLEFYENQTAIDLIHLTIVAQPLALEVPSGAINAMANNYTICQVNVTGAISGALLPGNANMTTDWDNPYQITNDSFGTFTLNFSTFDIPTHGVLESFTITIFANKTNYGATTGSITLIVNPIQTNANANGTVINAYLNQTIYLKVNYTNEGSNELISGANCSVEWQGTSNIVSFADEFIISLDTNGLSINDYTALITLEHVGYVTAFRSVTIIVNSIQTNADANKTVINVYFNETVHLKVNYTVEGSNELISGANCSVEWLGASNIVSVADEFIISLDTNGLSINDYTALMTLEHVGYATAFKSVTIIVNPIQTIADANKTVNNAYFNDVVYLKVNYTVQGSNELISGANCSVEWLGASNIVSVADEFIISLDTNGLSINDYTALMTLEHVGYITAFKSVTIIVNPIQTIADANKTVIYAYFNETVYLKVNYTVEGSNELISGANCSVEWLGASNIVSVVDEFIISLDTNGLSINDFTALMTLEHVGYMTAFKSVTIIVNPISTEATVNTSLVSIPSNEVVNLKVNYTVQGSNELILDSNCTVTWQGSSLINPVSDGFIITLFTNGLQVDYYSALIKLEKAGYEDAFDSVTIIINEQDVNLTVSINSVGLTANSLIESYFQQTLNLSARAYAVIDEEFLSGGLVTLISNNFEKNFTEIPSTYFSTSIILDGANFISGINNIFLRFEQTNYTTKIFPFQLFIRAQNVNLTAKINDQDIHEDYLLERNFNQEFNISCKAFAEVESVYLSGGNITFNIGDYEVELSEVATFWFNRTILISTSVFSIGPNYAYLRFQQNNYTTTIFTFQILVDQIEINVDTLNFEGIISGAPGETVLIKLNLTEADSTNYVNNATVFYSWNFGVGYFSEVGNGIYEMELVLPTGFDGNYDLDLIISKEGILHKTKEFTLLLSINYVEGPNFFIWIIITALIAISGILGTLSLRSYVILPKRREREAELMKKIQVFKDVWNIRAVILIHRASGLPIYSEEISVNDKGKDSTLISGFVQAITTFSENIVGKEFEASRKLATDYEYLRTIIDLDFKFFQLLVCDFETVRVLVILKDTASERLKKQLYLLTTVLHSLFGEELRNFSGSLQHLKNKFQDFFNQFLFLHFNKEFELTSNKNYYNSILESNELTSLETRLINVISSMTKINKKFTLKAAIDQIEETDEDLVLEALKSLISRKVILSPYSLKVDQKKSRV